MTITPEQRRRAVEVMAMAVSKDNECHVNPITCARRSRCFCVSDSEAALTALLTVADVTMKENGDG